MPEKLLTAKEAADLLCVSEEKLEALVQKGELPAYKIGGQYLRFRKEQLEAIRGEVMAKAAARENGQKPAVPLASSAASYAADVAYEQSFADKCFDIFYFYDFYIIAGFVIAIILWFIFK